VRQELDRLITAQSATQPKPAANARGLFLCPQETHAFDSIHYPHQKAAARGAMGLTGFGLFCLVGAAVVMALTPEAGPI
jgi:hypothetical protein